MIGGAPGTPGTFRIEGLTAGYGGVTVLRDVTLTVPARSVTALLGPNGAGKTTLLRVASGLLRPRSGRLYLGPTEVSGWPSEKLAAAGICHVPEGRGIFPGLTVRENLVLQARPGTERDSAEKAVEAFPILGDRMSQLAGTMSGGQQQMLALARAYVSDPQVVLLDEVSMGLAPAIVDEIFEFLHRLAAQGAALLLVEQYVTRALASADYVYLLNKGQVSFAGEPNELDDEAVFRSYLGAEVGVHS
ncbi:MAG TPA: ABC transporter ATP-binding protein [Acidimicrobiia bacterium]|nr:ABC transporter ATP-binding protein [Acidimicrobiia bacterium]